MKNLDFPFLLMGLLTECKSKNSIQSKRAKTVYRSIKKSNKIIADGKHQKCETIDYNIKSHKVYIYITQIKEGICHNLYHTLIKSTSL
jgi:hypothetical protein